MSALRKAVERRAMKIIFVILGAICGLWLLMDIACLLWFAWLHHKGELVKDVPEDMEDIF